MIMLRASSDRALEVRKVKLLTEVGKIQKTTRMKQLPPNRPWIHLLSKISSGEMSL